MAAYFISYQAYRPGAKRNFVGPYRKDEVFQEFQRAKDTAEYEVVSNDEKPKDVSRAIYMEVVTATDAKRSGMKASENTLPLTLEEVGLIPISTNGNHEVVKEETVQTVKREEEMINFPVTKKTTRSGALQAELEKSDAVIVTRNPVNEDLIEFYRQEGIGGSVITWVSADGHEIEGLRVVGTIPYRKSALAKAVGELYYNDERQISNFKSPRLDELKRARAEIIWYRVIKEQGEDAEILFFLDNPENKRKVLEMARSSK